MTNTSHGLYPCAPSLPPWIGRAVSPQTKEALDSIEEIKRGGTSLLSHFHLEPQSDGCETRAYNASANAKICFSQVANHLKAEWRNRLFFQLDGLHKIEEWEPDDQPVVLVSFRTFLRTIMVLKPERWPSLGLSHEGHVLAVWGDARDRVVLEFLKDDQLKWTLSHILPDGQIVRAAGNGPALNIRNLLSPYNPTHWFDAP